MELENRKSNDCRKQVGMKIAEKIKNNVLQTIVGTMYDSCTILDLENRYYQVVSFENGEEAYSEVLPGAQLDQWYDEFISGSCCHIEDRQNFREFVSWDNLIENYQEHKGNMITFVFRRKMTEKDINYRMVEMKVFFVEEEDGSPLALLFSRDILTSSVEIGKKLTLQNYIESMEFSDLIGKRKVLIVEDNELNREILREILSDEYTILEAENGKEGYELLREHYSELSIVLLDVHMPVMDGHEFLHMVKKDALLSQVPVIVMTSLGRDEEEVCLLLGATDFISKPYNHNVIRSRINSIIKLRESVDALNMTEVDELTGLYTRQAFCHHVDNVLKKNPDKQYDLVMSDIEDFKLFNERYGNDVGNEILRDIGKALKKASEFGILVGRHSEDRFVSFFEHSDDYTDDMLVQNYEMMMGNKNYQIRSKFGIYDRVDPDISASVLCDRAFMALQTIKHQYGKVYARFDDLMLNKIKKQQMIESNMRDALEQKQFRVYYQPKHDISTGKVVGAEALIRWVHPEYGFIMPGDFIPLFEKNGFISKVDYFVWCRTCENLKRWGDKGLKVVPVSVNASKIDFNENNYLTLIREPVEREGIDPSLLHIEVTETLFADRVEELTAHLNACRDYGFKIELDDFGTGYSSLNTLGTLPLDVIKLDMSFMRQIHDPRRIRVLSMCINLAKSLNLKTVCEGVENEEQIDLLRGLDVDCIQGYYYSRPLCEEDFEDYLRKYNS